MPVPKEPKNATGESGYPDKITVVAAGTTIQRGATVPFLVREGAPNPTEMRRLLAAGQYAITPGGIRPKSMIHTVKPGEIVARHGTSFQRFDMQRLEFVEPEHTDAEPLELPDLGSGWIVYAYFIESAANVIASMTTSWVVPAAPTAHDDQLIYLFNGLQDSPATHILQPVLQWDVPPHGGGANWAVVSMFVDSSGHVHQTPLVNVSPGDVLTGVMRMTGRNGSQFNYSSEFAGIPGTLLNVNGANQLVMPVETLECYSMSSCADYPAALQTSMRAIDVSTATGSIGLSFSPVNSVTDCGQHAVVVSNAAAAGQVDLYYRSQLGSVGSTGIAS
jgi:hypothetical protein